MKSRDWSVDTSFQEWNRLSVELTVDLSDCPVAVSSLAERLREAVPGAKVSLDPGGEKAGNWWVDVRLAGRTVTVEWQPGNGYRLYDPDGGGYGEGPMEVFRKPELAARRVAQFLQPETATASGS